jgi:hypothetical protein
VRVEPPEELAALQVVGRQQVPNPALARVRRAVAFHLLAPARQAPAGAGSRFKGPNSSTLIRRPPAAAAVQPLDAPQLTPEVGVGGLLPGLGPPPAQRAADAAARAATRG